MNRQAQVNRLAEEPIWDFLVIGGGAMGLGVASEAVRRGYRTALVEQSDFAEGTSSRSTKLIHGGIRYVQQGNIRLVREALHERKSLCEQVPELVKPLSFVIPVRNRIERFYYGFGLRCYDLLAGRENLQRSRTLTAEEVRKLLPTLKAQHTAGGITFQDAQFDDTRLAIHVAQEIWQHRGVALNYVRVAELLLDRTGSRVEGAIACDGESGEQFAVRARVVVNAAGVMADTIRRLEDQHCPARLRFSQGTHLVVDRRFQPGSHALVIPKTPDGRIIFVIPWHGKVLIGTTDVETNTPTTTPIPRPEEIEYLLDMAGQYLSEQPTHDDITSAFAGQRALVMCRGAARSHQVSRSHAIDVSQRGLVSILGGKWTTFRKIARQVVDRVAHSEGITSFARTPHVLGQTGSSRSLTSDSSGTLVPGLPYNWDDVTQAIRTEMARNVEDILARRTRILFLDAAAAIRLAEPVAAMLQSELGYTAEWRAQQVADFCSKASHYQSRAAA